ncbi:MAG TPA: glycosyltransferase [Bacteroidales bacterium]|nr:glycosyltransferase [Bacteroidales bacterium]
MQKNKIHIAIVAPWFPPLTGVAVNRIAAFAKYLKTADTEISVFTIAEKNAEAFEHNDLYNVYRAPNTAILKFIKTKTTDSKFLHYTKVIWNVCIRYFIKDEYLGWQKNTEKKLEQVHAEKPIDVVISSFFPAASHAATYNFLKDKPGIFWVTDMRDEMSFNTLNSSSVNDYYRKVEQWINCRANMVTTVSKPILDKYKVILKNINLFAEIRNGYDHNHLPNKHFNDIFTVIYAGTFYGKRKPDTFFEAVRQLHNEGRIDFRWKLKLIGANRNFHIPDSLKNSVEFSPFVPNEKMIPELFNADALLFVNPPTGNTGAFTGKIFEYISTGKPMIPVTVLQDVAADLISEYGVGTPVDFYDIEGIKRSFLAAAQLWKNKKMLDIPVEKIMLLHRRKQVDILYEAIIKNFKK